jgi:hypothetical protein
VRPLADDLYVLVALGVIVAVAVVSTARLRRLGAHSLVGAIVVVSVAVLVFGLEPVRRTDVAAVERLPDVAAVSRPAPASTTTASTTTVAPPVMRRVPVPTSTP